MSSPPVEDTVDDFFTFFLAGMETTANSMSFVLWYLLKHEEVYQKLQLEVFMKKQVLGSDWLSGVR